MGFFDKIKNYVREVSEFENNIKVTNKDYREIYERNQILEKEIIQRTQELNQANKTILTLQLVWEMMNSSTPLSSVLQKIVGSLSEELNYTSSVIIKLKEYKEEKFFEVIAITNSYFVTGNIL